MKDVFAKLEEMVKRSEDLEKRLSSPEGAAGARVGALLKERGRLAKPVAAYRQYAKLLRERDDARSMAEDSSQDAEFRELAREEIERLEGEIGVAEEKLIALAWGEEEGHSRDVIVEVRAGTGGDEAALFAADLFRMYHRYSDRRGWKLQVLDSSATGLGGYREIIFRVSGDGAYGRFRFESGTHRVQRVPKTEAQGRIHTSAATVAVMREADEVEVEIRSEDIEVAQIRSQGPGGQHVNTSSTSVRIVHKPTGKIVRSQVYKSQHQNKQAAMRILRSWLLSREMLKRREEESELRRSQIGSGDRSGRVRTYNYPQNRVTDHRLEEDKNFPLDRVVEGDIDPIVDRLQDLERAQALGAGW